jgi:hypothetical protein
MTQPEFVPIAAADRVRPVERLPVPEPWRSERPADVAAPAPPQGPGFGKTGPDLGYGLKLAKLLVPRLLLTEGESVDDTVAGCFAVGSRRAASFGRAPVIYDMELGSTCWGFLGDPPDDLVEFRRGLFAGAAHHYEQQRAIADLVREETLRLTPAQAAERLPEWKTMLDV